MLSKDESALIRMWVAWHPNTPLEDILALAKDGEMRVRARAAGNPKTPPEVLGRLANDDVAYVQEIAALNENITFSLLNFCMKDFYKGE